MKLQKSLLMVLLAAATTGCGSLVSSGQAPDELAVISAPPLTLPPNFELRPPQESKISRSAALRQQDASKEAEEILLGKQAEDAANEADWLLEQAGASTADPDIRSQLNTSETTE